LCHLSVAPGVTTAEIKFFFDVAGREEKPPLVFSKLLGKNNSQPQVVYLGFNARSMEKFCQSYATQELALGAFKKEITRLLIKERQLITQLCNQLIVCVTSSEEFAQYQQVYEQWVSTQIIHDWCHQETLTLPSWLCDRGFSIAIFDALRQVRKEIAAYLNKIELQPGMVLLSPVGYAHSIVGSLQTHPPACHPDAKTEAWVIISLGKDERGRDILVYYEPQQRPQGREISGKPKRKDVTYSLADWPTPIVWDTFTHIPKLRKNLCENLDALLASGESAPIDEWQAIALLVERALVFEPTQASDFLVNTMPSRIVDVTDLYGAAHLARAKLFIGGQYRVMPQELFQLHEITLRGNGKDVVASLVVKPQQGFDEQLVVLPVEGAVAGDVTLVDLQGVRTKLFQGCAVFVGAAQAPCSYVLESAGSVRVMRLMFPARKDLRK
ncbi:hypothetical protein CVU75_03260, partial [Candidatus Dependentiae bacterium HGW-Dependentiae-1]